MGQGNRGLHAGVWWWWCHSRELSWGQNDGQLTHHEQLNINNLRLPQVRPRDLTTQTNTTFIIIIIDHFYITLFSAFKQIHCASQVFVCVFVVCFFWCMLGYCRISIIHQTPTQTMNSLTCIIIYMSSFCTIHIRDLSSEIHPKAFTNTNHPMEKHLYNIFTNTPIQRRNTFKTPW